MVAQTFYVFYELSFLPDVQVWTLNLIASNPGLEVIKLFSSSAQLRMKFQQLINVKIVKISRKFLFKNPKLVIYPAHKC